MRSFCATPKPHPAQAEELDRVTADVGHRRLVQEQRQARGFHAPLELAGIRDHIMIAFDGPQAVAALHGSNQGNRLGEVSQVVVYQVTRQENQIGPERVGHLDHLPQHPRAGEPAHVDVGHVGDGHPVQRPRQGRKQERQATHAESAELRQGHPRHPHGKQRRSQRSAGAEEFAARRRVHGCASDWRRILLSSSRPGDAANAPGPGARNCQRQKNGKAQP